MTARPVVHATAIQTTSPSPATGSVQVGYLWPQCSNEPLGGDRCPYKASRRITAGCVHEHEVRADLCPDHHTAHRISASLVGDGLFCPDCRIAGYPRVPARILSDTPITAPAVSDKPATVSDT